MASEFSKNKRDRDRKIRVNMIDLFVWCLQIEIV